MTRHFVTVTLPFSVKKRFSNEDGEIDVSQKSKLGLLGKYVFWGSVSPNTWFLKIAYTTQTSELMFMKFYMRVYLGHFERFFHSIFLIIGWDDIRSPQNSVCLKTVTLCFSLFINISFRVIFSNVKYDVLLSSQLNVFTAVWEFMHLLFILLRNPNFT